MADSFTPEQKIHYDQIVAVFENLQKVPWDTRTMVKYQSSSEIIKKILPVIYGLQIGESFAAIDFVKDNFPNDDVKSCFSIIYPYISSMLDVELQDDDGCALEGLGNIQHPESFRVFRDGIEVDQSNVFVVTKRNSLLSLGAGL